jgi:LysM repeat protein
MKAKRTLQILFCSPILILLVAALLLPGSSQAQDAGVVVRFDPPSPTIAVGEPATVSIFVEGVTDLIGVSIVVNYDPDIVEVAGAPAVGDFLALDHDPEEMTVDPSTGEVEIRYRLESPMARPASGDGPVATIIFLGKANGVTDLILTEANLIGEGETLIPETTENGELTVRAAAAPTSVVPTPTFESPLPTATPTTPPPSPTPTETPSPTATGSPSPTPTPTSTVEPTGTPTAEPSPAPTATPQPTPLPVCDDILGQHVVRPGETLYAIGRAYAVRPGTIATCNGIINPSLIRPNTTLDIPNAPWDPVPPGPTARRQFGAVEPSCRFYHTVMWGENLFRISLRYRVSMWAIAEANGIHNLNYIRAGQVLCIP